MDKFYKVSYFITPFKQKGIYEWECDSFLNCRLKPCRVMAKAKGKGLYRKATTLPVLRTCRYPFIPWVKKQQQYHKNTEM